MWPRLLAERSIASGAEALLAEHFCVRVENLATSHFLGLPSELPHWSLILHSSAPSPYLCFSLHLPQFAAAPSLCFCFCLHPLQNCLACLLACVHACVLACLLACLRACLLACLPACLLACLLACLPHPKTQSLLFAFCMHVACLHCLLACCLPRRRVCILLSRYACAMTL